MAAILENYGYGSVWTDLHCDNYRGYLPNMSNYHMHEYYEISIILSGSVKIILPHSTQHGTQSRLLLIPPMTSHLVVCEPHLLYKRTNVLFSRDFLETYKESESLLEIFGKSGRVIQLTEDQVAEFNAIAYEMQRDENTLRRRFRLMIFLSRVAEIGLSSQEKSEILPSFVTEALLYIQEHYNTKIIASELAENLGIGRTTLMTAFKKYIGTTLNDYIAHYRVNRAIQCLKQGKNQQETSEICGFGEPCNLNRVFKRCLGVTPGEYLKRKIKNEL